MARLEAEVTANIAPFERALMRAGAEAREFAEKTKDVGKDVFKETAGGKAFNLLGLAGGTAAVTAFGVAIVDQLKESLGAFGKKETEQIQLKYNLPSSADAAEAHEFIEKLATGTGDINDLQSAFISLSSTGRETFENLKESLTDFYAISKKTGVPTSELAEGLRKAAAGGDDAVEGISRLIKTVPGLGAEMERQKDIWAVGAPQYPATGLRYTEEVARRRALPLAEFAKESGVDVKAMLSTMHEMAPRGILAETKGSVEGAEGRLAIVLDNLRESLGEGLAPAIKTLVSDLNENLPSIESNLKDFGAEIGKAISFIENLFKPKEGRGNWFLEHEEKLENKYIWNPISRAFTGQEIFPTPGTTPAGNLRDLANKEEQEKTNNALEEINKTLAQVFS